MARTYGNYNSLIDFTRASSGTALRPISYGDELVTNGTFDSDLSGWTTGSSVTSTYSSGTAEIFFGGSLESGDPFGDNWFSQSVFESGKSYVITFDATYVSGVGGLYVGHGYNLARTITSSGSYLVFINPDEGSFLDADRLTFGGDYGTVFKLDNISVREVLFDQPNGTLTLFNHPNNVPRIEYDANGNLLGLLVEESRTNLVTYSEDFTQWTTVSSGTGSAPVVTADYAISPDGSQNASRIVFDKGIGTTSSDYSGIQIATSGIVGGASIWLRTEVGTVDIALRLNLIGTYEVKTVTTDWQRFSFFDTASATSGPQLILRGGYGTDDTCVLLAFGAQLEAGSFPTSYIPTSGSTATRSADVASIGVSEFGYNQSEGTVVVEFQNTEIDSTDRMVSINDGSGNNAYQIQHVNGASTSGRIRVGATDYMFSNRTAISSGKAALLYSEEYAQFATDGSANAQDTTVATATMTSLNIGHINGASHCNGHIKSLRYFPRKLTASQLEALTS